jgi:hypothetical protein
VLSGRVNHAARLPAAITATVLLSTNSPLVRNPSRPLDQVSEPFMTLFRLNDVLLNDLICIIMLITQLYSSSGSEMWIPTNKEID